MNALIRSIILPALLIPALQAPAATLSEVRFHDEHADTTRLATLLDHASDQHLQSPNAWIGYFARQLEGTPYKAGTIEGNPEMLTINMEEMDCTTYLETVIALAMTASERRWSWRDFVHNLQRIRYRNGEVNGYSSRLHYMSDWIIDNTSRGIVRDFTSAVGSANYIVKTLDYMSTHRDSYPAMSDDAEFIRMKAREDAYRGHRYPYIKKGGVRGAQLREGDIVMIVTSTKGLDVQHVGFIAIEAGKAHLIHASSKGGRVLIDKLPLDEYMRKQTSAQGIRVVRLIE